MIAASPVAILLSVDLMFGSHLRGAAQQNGWRLLTAATWDHLQELLASHDDVALAIIDLSTPRLPLETASFADLKNRGIRSVAFGPHVHRDKLTAARAAGCSQVISRGQLHQQAGEIFTKGDGSREAER